MFQINHPEKRVYNLKSPFVIGFSLRLFSYFLFCPNRHVTWPNLALYSCLSPIKPITDGCAAASDDDYADGRRIYVRTKECVGKSLTTSHMSVSDLTIDDIHSFQLQTREAKWQTGRELFIAYGMSFRLSVIDVLCDRLGTERETAIRRRLVLHDDWEDVIFHLICRVMRRWAASEREKQEGMKR